MAIIRPNILRNAGALQNYTKGVNLLKNEFTGPTTDGLGISGRSNPVSTYDLFVVWHQIAMMTLTPPTQGDRNAAHSGPVFPAWHRFMLRLLELNLQRILNDNSFGLPYWDWADDGMLPPNQQPQSNLWAANCMGSSGSPVTTGPFAFNPNDPKSFRVKIEADSTGQLQQTDRGLTRQLASEAEALPTRQNTASTLANPIYDAAPWDRDSTTFRNGLEGWNPYGMHNLVHVWVGGDMLPATSPNDPVFFLNHCNVDRIWEAWMQKHRRIYLPLDSAPASLKGHRLNDKLSSLVSAPTTPAAVLDMTAIYGYDSLIV